MVKSGNCNSKGGIFFFAYNVFEKPSITSLFNPLPDEKIFDWFKLKHSADDNIEFDLNSRKFSKLVENNVGKGEIALYEQFLLFPQCFLKVCFPGASKGVIVWEWVNSFLNKPWFLRVCSTSVLKTLHAKFGKPRPYG